ncbi:MAG: MCE family protein [Deltaproteobacteria bacterium]|nr:MCE family protein [Deltaproteobacteria bacterium]
MALSTEKKVGLFFILGLILFTVMLELGGQWNPFEKAISYQTFLTSVTGLKIGDSVRLAGVDVGKIKGIDVLEGKVRIDFEVKKGTKIRQDTVASLRMTNLLGGQFLGLSFGSPTAPLLPPGATVASKEAATVDTIMTDLGDITTDAKTLIADLNKNQAEVLGSMSAMLEENRPNIRSTMSNLSSITTKMDRGDGSLAMLLNDKTLYANTNDVTSNLKTITAKIERGEGTIGKLVNDDAFYLEARSAMANINDSMKDVKEIAGKINSGEGTMAMLLNDKTLYTELSSASKNVKEITEKINNGQGTMGKLVNEDKLYRDATATLKKTEQAVAGMGDSGAVSVLGSIIGSLF